MTSSLGLMRQTFRVLLPLLVLAGLAGVAVTGWGVWLFNHPVTYSLPQLTPSMMGKLVVLRDYRPAAQFSDGDGVWWYPIVPEDGTLTKPLFVRAWVQNLNSRAVGQLRAPTPSDRTVLTRLYGPLPDDFAVIDFTDMGGAVEPGVYRILLGVRLMSIGFGLGTTLAYWLYRMSR